MPGTGSYPPLALAVALAVLVGVPGPAAREPRAAPTHRVGRAGSPVVRGSRWTSAGFTKPLRLVLESVLRPRREIEVIVAAGCVQSVTYEGRSRTARHAAV